VVVALINCDFFSDVLGLSSSMTVILPQETTSQIGLAGSARPGGAPVLYLLHGLSDDHTIWLRRTSIERYVAPLGLAVVMPQVHRSFYTDEYAGNRYWTFLSEELPALAHSFFRLSDRREDTFVAGLSMGGYGAFKWALTRPERFAAAASLSGVLDVSPFQSIDDAHGLLWQVFGPDPIEGGDHDLFALLASASDGAGALPALYACCGADDPLAGATTRFAEAAARRSVDITTEIDAGSHDWGYWDRKIQDILNWLPLHPAHD
jgi:putative tributyrin esterase